MIEFLANAYKYTIAITTALCIIGLALIIFALVSGRGEDQLLLLGASVVYLFALSGGLLLVFGISAVLISTRDSQRRSEGLLRELLARQPSRE